MVDNRKEAAENKEKNEKRHVNFTKYVFFIYFSWTVLVAVLTVNQLKNLSKITDEIVINEGRTHFKKDQAFRLWGAMHGGVYVPATERTPPNKYLVHVKERDIKTPSGVKLTLINPAYMVRQIKELYSEQYGVSGHLTSLNLINPDNAPDEWEKEALLAFEKGAIEKMDFVEIDGEKLYRYIGRLITKRECLKCHGDQGYKEGDVRGGISVTIPMAPYLEKEKIQAYNYVVSFSIIWLLGVFGIGFGAKRIKQRIAERDRAYRELTQYKIQLEILVNRRTKELSEANLSLKNKVAEAEKANEEIRNFTNIMSHDLKGPLTSIIGMAELLEQEFKGSEDEKSAHLLSRIRANAFLMSDFLSDLLEFARVGRTEDEKESVDVNSVISQILLEKHAEIKEIGANIVYAKGLPSIHFSKRRMYQIFSNLIVNALKFARDDVDTEIIIDYNDTDIEHIILVKDNGIGIAEENHDKVFQMFQRLKEKDVEGTGIGLAIVKKIVEDNDARIWLESEVGKGSTFFVAFKRDKAS